MIIFRALAILGLLLRVILVVLLLLILPLILLFRVMLLLCLILTLVASVCALLAGLSLYTIVFLVTCLCRCLLDVLRDYVSSLPLLLLLLDILECLALLHDSKLRGLLIISPQVLACFHIVLLGFLVLLLIDRLLLIMSER